MSLTTLLLCVFARLWTQTLDDRVGPGITCVGAGMIVGAGMTMWAQVPSPAPSTSLQAQLTSSLDPIHYVAAGISCVGPTPHLAWGQGPSPAPSTSVQAKSSIDNPQFTRASHSAQGQ